MWNRTLLVFTHSARLDSAEFAEHRVRRPQQILEEILRHAPNTDLVDHESVCIDNRNELQGNGVGLAQLWTLAVTRMAVAALPSFIISQSRRLVDEEPRNRDGPTASQRPANPAVASPEPANGRESRIVLNEHQRETVTRHVERWVPEVIRDAAAGAAVGGVFAGPVGAVVGAALGAMAGFFFRKLKS